MRLARALVLSADVYAFVQHTGTWFTWLGAVPVAGVVTRTRWADWIDIVTPDALLSAGAWVLNTSASHAHASGCSTFSARRATALGLDQQ